MGFFDNIGVKIVNVKATNISTFLTTAEQSDELFECEQGSIILFNQEFIKSAILKYVELSNWIDEIKRSSNITDTTTNSRSDRLRHLYNTGYNYDRVVCQLSLIKTFIVTFVRNYEVYIDHPMSTKEMEDLISDIQPDIKAFTCCLGSNIRQSCSKCIFFDTNKLTNSAMTGICHRMPCRAILSNSSNADSNTNNNYYFKLV